MKLITETGSQSGSTSYASCRIFYEDGPYKGKQLYEVRSTIQRTEWDEKWATTEYDLPEGTILRIVGKGGTGPRAVNKHNSEATYKLNPEVEVTTIQVNVGLRICEFTGRLQEVTKVVPVKINRTEGF